MFHLSHVWSITCIILVLLPPVYSNTGSAPLLERMLGALRDHVGLSVFTLAATGVMLTWLLNQYNAGQHFKELIGGVQRRRRQLKGITILYCTEEGTTQIFADILQKDAGRRQINATAVSLKDYKPENTLPLEIEPGHLFVIVVATEIEGVAPSEDAACFHRWLHDGAAGCRDLRKLDYAVVGVGDGQHLYTFCKVALDIDKSLAALGSHRIARVCIVDEDASESLPIGVDSTFVAWTEELWAAVETHYSEPFKNKPCSCSKKTCCTKDGAESGSGDDEGSGTRTIMDIEDLVAASSTTKRQTERKTKPKGTHHRAATKS